MKKNLLVKTQSFTLRRTKYLRYLLLVVLAQPMAQAVGQDIFVKGGVNISSIAGLPETSSLIGYHIGVGGMKAISGNLSLKHELFLSQQGTKVSADSRLIYYYLNVPILLSARYGERFSFHAGPQVGMALKAISQAKSDKDITANLNPVDLSFCLGVNYLIGPNFFAEGRYNVGLTNHSRISESKKNRNAVFQGSVGYYFNRKNDQRK